MITDKKILKFNKSICKNSREEIEYMNWIVAQKDRVYETDENNNVLNQDKLLEEFRAKNPTYIQQFINFWKKFNKQEKLLIFKKYEI